MTVLSIVGIDGQRLNDHIESLAKIGQRPDGSLCRLAFTPEDIQARYRVQQWMVEAGMQVRTDAAGNLIGRYEGEVADAPALATGSHIDTVPSGGRYDGVLGVLAGIEAVRALRDRGQRLNHPVEVIVFSDEENTMIGCQAIAGTALLDAPERYQTNVDAPIQDCLEMLGGSWEQLATARRTDLAAFVELHVEQGIVLEYQQKTVGIVQGVVGIHRSRITITGQANHAGTTPMDMRQDALVAAAETVLAVRQIALAQPSQPVATVGQLEVSPNAVNIVPGQVTLSVDMRDLSPESLEAMTQQLEQKLDAIALKTRTKIAIEPLLYVEPTPAAAAVQQVIQTVCQDLNLSHLHLPSRAGHDALELGRITNMGMIFVPSADGVSHSEAEYTSPEDCVHGANVLLQTLIRLDAILP